jgi:hypothetical protein
MLMSLRLLAALAPLSVASESKRQQPASFVDVNLAMNIALGQSQSYLPPEEKSTARFRLNRANLDAMMPLVLDEGVIRALDNIRHSAVYENDKLFLLDFHRYRNRQISEILSRYNVWGESSYSPDLMAELRSLLIEFISGLASLCLLDYLPGNMLRNYSRFFVPIEYTETAARDIPRNEKGFEYVGSFRPVPLFLGRVSVLNANVISVHNHLETFFYDVSRRCAVRYRSAGGKVDLLPDQRTAMLSGLHRYIIFAGFRNAMAFSPEDPGTTLDVSLYPNTSGTGALILVNSQTAHSGRKEITVSVISAVTRQFVMSPEPCAIRFPPSRIMLHGDYLAANWNARLTLIRAIHQDDPRLPVELLHTIKDGFETVTDAATGSPRRGKSLTIANFASGTAIKYVPDAPPMTVLHIYRIPQLKAKLRRIVAACEEFWKTPGVPEQVRAKKPSDKWESVIEIGSRQNGRAVGEEVREFHWPFKALKAFDADKYNEMTVAHLEKLFTQ